MGRLCSCCRRQLSASAWTPSRRTPCVSFDLNVSKFCCRLSYAFPVALRCGKTLVVPESGWSFWRDIPKISPLPNKKWRKRKMLRTCICPKKSLGLGREQNFCGSHFHFDFGVQWDCIGGNENPLENYQDHSVQRKRKKAMKLAHVKLLFFKIIHFLASLLTDVAFLK